MKREAREKRAIKQVAEYFGPRGTYDPDVQSLVVRLLRAQHRAFVDLVKEIRQAEVGGLNIRQYLEACDAILAALRARGKGGGAMKDIPTHARLTGETVRQFKQRKRREIRAAIAAFERFRYGCAYAPGFSFVRGINQALEQIKQACQVKRWR